MLSFINNKESDKVNVEGILCADIEKKEKFWKFTSITLFVIIAIFCLLIWYGYTVASNYQVDY